MTHQFEFPMDSRSNSLPHLFTTMNIYTHTTGDPSIGKQRNKPGRKPCPLAPASKRLAQNRIAQRAYRERKENHLKYLEHRIAMLEATNHEKSQIIHNLQRENQELKNFSPATVPKNGSQPSLDLSNSHYNFNKLPSLTFNPTELLIGAEQRVMPGCTTLNSDRRSLNDCLYTTSPTSDNFMDASSKRLPSINTLFSPSELIGSPTSYSPTHLNETFDPFALPKLNRSPAM